MFDITSNLRRVTTLADRLGSQFEFATASALTAMAKQVREGLPGQAERDLEQPTPFTRSGFYFTPARKTRLTATVGVKDLQARYLVYQVRGGTRKPTRRALRLPSDVELNQYGNMPAGLVRQLVARAKQGKRTTKTQAARFGVSQSLDLFYGEPEDGRPAGVYKRVKLAGNRDALIAVVVFPKQAAQYQKRFDFYGYARRTVEANALRHLRTAWARARATAR